MLRLLRTLVRIMVLAAKLGRMGEEREKKNVIFVVELTTEKKLWSRQKCLVKEERALGMW